MRKVMVILFLVFISNAYSSELTCDFDCTLKKHMDAIQSRDFVAFESTLTNEKRLTFLLPNGTYFESTKEYKKLLKEWFETKGWSLTYKTIAIEKTESMGHALLLVSYDEKDRGGKPYHLDHYLSLLFKKFPDGWKLVHDQNTKTKLK